VNKPKRSAIQFSEFSRGVLRDRPIDRLPPNGLADSYGFEVATDGALWTEPRYEELQVTGLPGEYFICGAYAFPLAANDAGLYYVAVYSQDSLPALPRNQIYANRRDDLTSPWEVHLDFEADEDGMGATYQRPVNFSNLNAKVFAGWFGYGLYGDPDGTPGPPDYGVTTFDGPILHTPSGDNLMGGIGNLTQHHQRLYAPALGGPDVTILYRSEPGDGETWNDNDFDSPKNYSGSNIAALYSEDSTMGIIYGTNLMGAYGEAFENRRFYTLAKRFGTVTRNTVVLRPDGRGAFCLGHENEVYYIPQGVQVPIRVSGELNRYRYIGDKNDGASADALGDYYRISPVPNSAGDYSLVGYDGTQQEGNTGWTYNWRLGAWSRSAQWKEWTPSYISPQAGTWSWVQSAYDEGFRRNIRCYSRLDADDTSVIHYLDVNRELSNRHLRSTDDTIHFFETGAVDLGEAVDMKDSYVVSVWMEPMYRERVGATPSSFRVAVSVNGGAYNYIACGDRALPARQADGSATPTNYLWPLDGLPHRGYVGGDFTVATIQFRVEFHSEDIVDTYTDPDFGPYLAQGAIFRDLVVDFRADQRETSR